MKRQFLIITLVILGIFCSSCEKSSTTSSKETKESEISISQQEQILKKFAKLAPSLMKESDLSKILYQEINKKIDNDNNCETSVLWSDISKISISKKSLKEELRETLELSNSLQKSSSSFQVLAELDTLGTMQLFIHNFENWDGESVLLSTYTPLDENDIEVEYLTLYDDLGREYELNVNTFSLTSTDPSLGKIIQDETNEPILIIGINEDPDPIENPVDPPVGDVFKILSVKIKKDAMNYEPWWKGKAELYFQVINPEAAKEERWSLGVKFPSGNIKYSCWEREGLIYHDRHYWKDIDKVTGFPYPKNRDYNELRLKLIEYDPGRYDYGEYSNILDIWIGLAGTAAGIVWGSTLNDWQGWGFAAVNALATITAIVTYNERDDVIGKIPDFNNKMRTVFENENEIYTFKCDGFILKVKSE